MANEVDKVIDVVDGTITQAEADAPEYQRLYQVYEDSRIPVSKSVGKLWNNRFNEIKSNWSASGAKDRWEEAFAYYENDQAGMGLKRHRLSTLSTGKSSEKYYMTENIVYANASALVPATYAKNPDIEITSENEKENRAKVFEKLVDVLFKKKNAPGLNIKPKLRKCVLTTTLANYSYIGLSYILKEDSSEGVVEEISKLAKQLEEAKHITEVEEIEGKLQALEEKVNLLNPSGPKCKFYRPEYVLLDPAGEGVIEDCSYIIVGEFVRTSYIRAMYGRKDEKGNWLSIYKPTHILAGEVTAQGHDKEIENFSLLQDGDEHEKFGFKSKQDFEHSCHTLVWTVWDKTTRRAIMFHDGDWTWPIWVWDDPYKLSRFFPVFGLVFNTSPKDAYAKSEVMYYLDQQDEINMINNERARMRHWAASKVFVNTAHIKDANTIARFLHGDTDDLVQGLNLPDGVKIGDAIGPMPLPSTQLEQLFDNRAVLESINRLSSVTPVLQNVQYKTNTTNRAIESYESSTQMRLDEKIDAIEEMLADIGVALLEMCVQFMPRDDVARLVGEEFLKANGDWEEGMTVEQFNSEYTFTVVGGSTLKPTSKVKKEQAAQLGQILGQFANASPMIIIVLLKMLERAYGEDVVIEQNEWNMIIQATMQQMQRGGAQQGQPQEGQPQQQEGAPPQEGQADPNAIMDQVAKVIDSLPQQARAFLAKGIAQGVPLKQLVTQLTQAAGQQRPN